LRIGGRSRRSFGDWTTAPSGVPSRRNWAPGPMPICAFGVGRCVACGMRSWRMWWRRESRNWRLPASTARSRAHIRRRPGRGRANPSAGSAIHSHRRVSGGGAGAVERWAWHQDRRRVRCRRAAGRASKSDEPSPLATTRPLFPTQPASPSPLPSTGSSLSPDQSPNANRLCCLVAEHCWDPVGLAIVEYGYRFERLKGAAGKRR
jgi:hypothetical protein